jgi:superoxide dismutase, Fe-Mn family
MENTNTRRNFIKKTAILSVGTIVGSSIINNNLASELPVNNNLLDNSDDIISQGGFTLPKLPYSYEALEPHIDKLTMEIHHSKHHNAYVTNLNKALEGIDSKLLGASKSLESIFDNMESYESGVKNNAGGHYNHTLFWTLMKPNGGGEPKGKLGDAIKSTFGSFEEFKKKFSDAASKRFGSGWAWLIIADGKLTITSTPNQDNPLMNLKSKNHIKGKPILALDVWEHAYYLKNQNRRADYIASFWNVINWETAEKLYNS